MSSKYVKPEVILQRNNSLISALSIKVEELSTSRIYGVWNILISKAFQGLLNNIQLDVGIILQMKGDLKYEWLIIVNDKLEEILSHVDNVINSTSSNTALHEFVSNSLRVLELSKEIPYVICEAEQLATLSLIKDWNMFFKRNIFLFKNTYKFITEFRGQYKDISLIFIPPIVLQNKEYWCLILHEIGHILTDRYSLVTEFNPEIPLKDANSDAGRNFFHAREYISDFIAGVFFGPVLYECLHEYLLTVRKYYGGTHPSWDARMYFLEQNKEVIITKNLIRRKPPVNHTSISNINKMIDKTKKEIFTKKSMYYQKNTKETHRAVSNLKEAVPYIGSPRIMLNAYNTNKQTILKSLKSKLSDKNTNPEFVVFSIIEDSIRLTNMRETFHLMEKFSQSYL